MPWSPYPHVDDVVYRIQTPIDALTHTVCRISHGTLTEEVTTPHDLPELWNCRCVCVPVEDVRLKVKSYPKLEPTVIDRQLAIEVGKRLRAAYRLGRAAGFFIGVCGGTLGGVAATVLWCEVFGK